MYISVILRWSVLLVEKTGHMSMIIYTTKGCIEYTLAVRRWVGGCGCGWRCPKPRYNDYINVYSNYNRHTSSSVHLLWDIKYV
jgi:hypothetical protein